MFLQRAGVAVSPELHVVLTSSLSAELKGLQMKLPIRFCQVYTGIPVIKNRLVDSLVRQDS